MSQREQGIEDQYVYSCCAAQHNDKPCVLFGVEIDEQGEQWAIIGYVCKVPVDEVATWSRKKGEEAYGLLSTRLDDAKAREALAAKREADDK